MTPFAIRLVTNYTRGMLAKIKAGAEKQWLSYPVGSAAWLILISCLGLFGVAAFTAERRFKEIGIRKVLGASVSGVFMMLTTDFLKLIGIAIIIAFPLAWWATNQWLNGFAYRIHTGPGLFMLAGVSTLLITVLTIGYQAVKAAVTNPISSLRSE